MPFAGLAPPCLFRSAAVAAKGGCLPCKPAFARPSLSGLWDAADSGFCITARTTFAVPPALAILAPVKAGLPPLPRIPRRPPRG
jgi:hypothetical protein